MLRNAKERLETRRNAKEHLKENKHSRMMKLPNHPEGNYFLYAHVSRCFIPFISQPLLTLTVFMDLNIVYFIAAINSQEGEELRHPACD